jgi:hypothetical protein
MSAKSYLITIDGNTEIQAAKERLFNLAPDFVHSIEKDAARITALEAQNKKLVEALKWAWDNMKFTEYEAAEDAEYEFCLICGKPKWKHDKDCEGLKRDQEAASLLSEVTQ